MEYGGKITFDFYICQEVFQCYCVSLNTLLNSHVDSLTMFIQVKFLPERTIFSRFPAKVILSGLNSNCWSFNPSCLQFRFDYNCLFPLVLVEGRDAKEAQEKAEKKKLKNCLWDKVKFKVELHIVGNFFCDPKKVAAEFGLSLSQPCLEFSYDEMVFVASVAFLNLNLTTAGYMSTVIWWKGQRNNTQFGLWINFIQNV